MPVLGTLGDALGEGAAPLRGEMPPLMLVNSAKRVVPDAHDGEVSSVCVDGDHCVTAGWDGQLRFWGKHDAFVARSFELVQRAQAHEDAVKTVATIADKWVISAGLNGLCRVWTRSGEAAMHPSQIPEPTPENPNGDDRAPPPPKHPLPVDDLGDDNAEEVGSEMEELRLARTERKRVLAQYDGPWKCVGAFDGGAGGCVNAVVGLHAPEDAGCVGKPPAIAVAVGSRLGSMTHAVRILDPTRNWATIQVLEHPEGVTAAAPESRMRTGRVGPTRHRVPRRSDTRVRQGPGGTGPEAAARGAGGGRRSAAGCRCRDGGTGRRRGRQTDVVDERARARARAVVPSVPTRGDARRASHRRRHPMARRAPRVPTPRSPPRAPRPRRRRREGMKTTTTGNNRTNPGTTRILARVRQPPVARLRRHRRGVKLWERRRVPTKPWGLPHWGYEPPPEPPKGEAKEYAWCRTPSPDGEIQNAPLAPRIADDENAKIESFAEARLTCVRVWREHVTVGLGDGRMCTWGRRVHDESGVAGWVLERITPAPADRWGR